PEIVVEIVSFGSVLRDYEEKREEYLALGIREYWIIDVNEQEMTVFRRWRGTWSEKTYRPGDVYTTRLLPGFELPCADVLEAVCPLTGGGQTCGPGCGRLPAGWPFLAAALPSPRTSRPPEKSRLSAARSASPTKPGASIARPSSSTATMT